MESYPGNIAVHRRRPPVALQQSPRSYASTSAGCKNHRGNCELWKLDTRKELGVYRTKSIFDCRFGSVAVHGDWLYVMTGNGINFWDNTDGKVNAKAPSLLCLESTKYREDRLARQFSRRQDHP